MYREYQLVSVSETHAVVRSLFTGREHVRLLHTHKKDGALYVVINGDQVRIAFLSAYGSIREN